MFGDYKNTLEQLPSINHDEAVQAAERIRVRMLRGPQPLHLSGLNRASRRRTVKSTRGMSKHQIWHHYRLHSKSRQFCLFLGVSMEDQNRFAEAYNAHN